MSEAMKAFDKVAWRKGDEQAAALQGRCAFAKEGKLWASLRPLDEGERRQLREAAKAGRLR